MAPSNTRSRDVLDKAIVSFNNNDELAKYYFGEKNASLFIARNGEEYAIAGAEGLDEIPVCFKATRNGAYTINVTPKAVAVDYLHLIDNLTGSDIDLLATPSYSFNAQTDDYASRFKLVFSVNASETVSESTFAFVSNGQVTVNGEGTLQVIDPTGHILGTRDASHGMTTKGMAKGVYVLRLINGENIKTQKIVIR